MEYQKLALILGNCLFPDHHLLSSDKATLFFMAEDSGLCTHFKYHQQKLVFFLSAMRSHADRIREKYPLVYWELTTDNQQLSYQEKLIKTLQEHAGIKEIVTYDIEDHFFDKRLRMFCNVRQIKLTVVASPAFMTTKKEFEGYLKQVKKPFMHTFYQRQRKKFNVLVDEEGKPHHGKWSFDHENRKKLPKDIIPPQIPAIKLTDHTEAVKVLVAKLFPDHPGILDTFNWATTREQVLNVLNVFLKERLQHFGPYEDAIDKDKTFLFHAVLSPYINAGLIVPEEVLAVVLKFAENNGIHYPSLEGFVRQIIGWREFIRGIYHHYDDEMRQNYFNHTRKMKACWYTGDTGIPPVDSAIKKALKYGYTHHIERLMVLGNIMLLCEIHPDEVYQWFMEMYVDSSDWVMVPNVYGMSQFADGGIFATKPYVAGANYILKMSNYPKKGEWVDVMNGLYWRFIQNKRSLFERNPRMSMMPKMLDKMDSEKRKNLFGKAEAFIEKVTC